MKVLHTADWHLGQKFMHNDREEEHGLALQWLLETIVEKEVDLLIVAGDIFDTGSPANYARQQYFNFLKKLNGTCCHHVVIVGGNHDSPAMLNASKELMQLLDIHVVGSASEDIENDIFELKDKDGQLEAVVAAVPFLRDRDIRLSIAGESSQERLERIKVGIYNYYQKAANAVEKYVDKGVPIITTGHLYATGAKASARQDNIYVGNVENIDAEEFPEIFDYVALGHIHKAQKLEQSRIRYSGSLIPLSFKENVDKKSVTYLEFEQRELASKTIIPIPIFRQLLTIQGDLETVQAKLADVKSLDYTAWVEVIVETEKIIPNLDGLLRDFTQDMPLELLKIKTLNKHRSLDEGLDEVDLSYLDNPLEIFKQKCQSEERTPEEMEDLITTFKELQEWMRDKSE